MKLICKAKLTLTIALSIAAATVGKTIPAQAFSFYFGEDLGKGDNVRLTNPPNAYFAFSNFIFGLNERTMWASTVFFDDSYLNNTGGNLAINFGGISGTLIGNAYVNSVSAGTNQLAGDPDELGRYPAGMFYLSDKYLEAGTKLGINLSYPISAFGFYGTDVGDLNGQLTMTVSNTSTNFQQTVTVPHKLKGLSGGVIFFGLISDEGQDFNRISFGNTATGVDYFSISQVTIGLVPEPLTMAGMILGGAMLAGARKLRQGR